MRTRSTPSRIAFSSSRAACLLAVTATMLLSCGGDQSGWSFTAREDAWVIGNGAATLELPRAAFAMKLDRGGRPLLQTADGDGEFAAAAIVTRGQEGETTRGIESIRYAGEVPGAGGPSASFSMMAGDGRLAILNVTPSGDDGFHVDMRPDFAAIEDPVVSWGFSFDIESAGYMYGQGILTAQKNYREQQFNDGVQHFPMNTGSFERPIFTTDEGTNIVTPLWLTSKGLAIFMDSWSSMSLSFNRPVPADESVTPNGIFKMHVLPLEGEESLPLDFLTDETTVDAYRQWVARKWTNRPDLPAGARPPDEVFTRPIWTTWAAYKWDIDQERILEFAHSIVDHGYDAGIVEIDDKWTAVWGDLRFDAARFPDAAAMVDEIHGLGADVTAWVPPFVNTDAVDFQEGVTARAYAGGGPDDPYPALVGWWDVLFVPFAGTIDFTTDAGRDWWGGKVDVLAAELGLDGFKYDAGETCFLPKPVTLAAEVPFNAYPDYYASWGLEHRAAELRAAWFSQHQPVLFRMFDKNSEWGLENGMSSVVTQYLALGMIGYPFVMPDMLGGNEYLQTKCDDELMIRWAQMNALMPCIQYSILPWRDTFAPTTNEIVKKFHDIRAGMADEFIRLADEAAATQIPMVRPLFFEFPDDEATYAIGDQFMLGDRWLVAPVLEKGAVSRDVYLPEGRWTALDDPEESHEGPVMLKDYPAPIDRLPAFRLSL